MAILSYPENSRGMLTAKQDPSLSVSPLNSSIVFGSLGYGSYSGADIKVVVHLPYDARLGAKIRSDIAGIQDQINDQEGLISYYDSVLTGSPAPPNQRYPTGVSQGDAIRGKDVANGTLISLTDELDSKQKIYQEINSIGTTKVLGELQTISWSVFREKYPVRTLGSVYPRSYTRGPRCLPAGQKVFIKDKGLINIEEVKLGDYIQSSGFDFNKVLGTFQQGIKKCYSLKLKNGYSLIASYDHPISTSLGWVKMQDLKHGDLVHVCGSTPSHDKDYDISNDLLKMLGYLIGDGTTKTYNYNGKKTTRIGLSIADCEMNTIGFDSENCLYNLNIDFNDTRKNNDKCISRVINVCKPNKGLTGWQNREYNLLHQSLLKYNMYNKYSFEKSIPQEFLYKLSTKQIVLFLRHLFATDGGYSISKDKKYIEFKYTSTSELLIDQIRLLLNKLGVNAIKSKEDKVGKLGGRSEIISKHDSFSLVVSDALELLRFIRRIGVFGKDEKILPYLSLLTRRIKYHFYDIDPKDFVKKIREITKKNNLSIKAIDKKFNLYNKKLKITPRRAYKIAEYLNNDIDYLTFLYKLTEDLINKKYNLLEKPVVSITEIGYLPVYDLEVEDRHRFICNNIVVHNTIGGSMIFTVFHKHAFHEILNMNLGYYSTGTSDHDRYLNTTNLPDQMPPLDISIVFANEYGALSHMGLWGVDINQEGGTFSIEDIFSENVMQYVARDLDPIRVVGTRQIDGQGVKDEWSKTASSLLYEKRTMDDHLKRRNPFV